MSLERLWEKILCKKKLSFVRLLLYLISLAYKAVLLLRHKLYDTGVFSSEKFPICTVSIGNIAMGGTGKTPLTLLLAKELQKEFRLAILSRGYRSKLSGKESAVFVNDFKNEKNFARLVGDEPALLSQKLPSSEVWIGKDRRECAREALKQGADLLLLDDAMQHRKIKKDFEICVLSADAPLSTGYLFPRGKLRDLPSRLQQVDYVVVQGVSSTQQFLSIEEKLKEYTSAPCIGMSFLPPRSMEKSPVGVFCAIANPKRFLDFLESNGAVIAETWLLGDHEEVPIEKLKKWMKALKNRGIKTVYCTEKDFVKLEDSENLDLPLVPIELQIQISYNKRIWDEMIEKIRQNGINWIHQR